MPTDRCSRIYRVWDLTSSNARMPVFSTFATKNPAIFRTARCRRTSNLMT